MKGALKDAFYLETNLVKFPGQTLPQMKPHKHDFDEYIIFLGPILTILLTWAARLSSGWVGRKSISLPRPARSLSRRDVSLPVQIHQSRQAVCIRNHRKHKYVRQVGFLHRSEVERLRGGARRTVGEPGYNRNGKSSPVALGVGPNKIKRRAKCRKYTAQAGNRTV